MGDRGIREELDSPWRSSGIRASGMGILRRRAASEVELLRAQVEVYENALEGRRICRVPSDIVWWG